MVFSLSHAENATYFPYSIRFYAETERSRLLINSFSFLCIFIFLLGKIWQNIEKIFAVKTDVNIIRSKLNKQIITAEENIEWVAFYEWNFQ